MRRECLFVCEEKKQLRNFSFVCTRAMPQHLRLAPHSVCYGRKESHVLLLMDFFVAAIKMIIHTSFSHPKRSAIQHQNETDRRRRVSFMLMRRASMQMWGLKKQQSHIH
jgi:hypothetical protein